MAIVIVINQESGMAIPTRKHSKKMSVKIVKQKKRYIYIYILGDSMVKHIKGWDLSAKLDHHHNIYVRIFLELKLEV